MSTFADLLAKSLATPGRIRPGERLQGHTAYVLAAADELLDARGEVALQAARLPAGSEDKARLRQIVRLAAFVHDLGKCSDHFQEMVHKRSSAQQLVRHEALSLWLCWPGQPLAGWLRPAVESDRDYLIAVLAAVGHHRKFPANAVAEKCGRPRIRLLLSHPDFQRTLAAGRRELSLASPPAFAADRDLPERGAMPLLLLFDEWGEEAEEAIVPTSPEAKLLALCKALVLDADVAGSVLSDAEQPPRWIGERLRASPDPALIEEVVRRRLKGAPERLFQTTVAQSDAPLTFVRAGCGSGKTVAAYLWAARRHAGRQLWVTYPTTGTATEGFRGYVHKIDALAAQLEHSRAPVDEEIFGLRDDTQGQREADRLDSLRAWGAGVVVCTVDTVLSLIQNGRKGLYAFAGLCQGAVVFDEIHAYDDRLFGLLLRFLKELPGIPALLMTASLPTPRLCALQQLCTTVHGRPLPVLEGPADEQRLPRYQRHGTAEADALGEALAAVRACLDGQDLGRPGKVLWVSNTVRRCQALADLIGDRSPLLYHSRYCYEDRVRRHGDVIGAFEGAGPALALTTQVCEMSLDLSADLLVTDLAPVPALIQRLGRLNRRSTKNEPAGLRPFVVLPVDSALPYEDGELAAARAWLDRLGEGARSQEDLIAAWRDGDEDEPAPARSEWLDGLFQTRPGEVREAGYGITVLRAEHAALVEKGELRAMKVALPMDPPPGGPAAWRSWRQVRHLPVAPAELLHYDPLRGASWRRP